MGSLRPGIGSQAMVLKTKHLSIQFGLQCQIGGKKIGE